MSKLKRCRSLLTAIGAVFLLSISAQAEIRLPSLFTDHMVIQRGLPVHVWGRSAPNESVSVTFHNETRSTVADPVGYWSLYLSPAEAGGPFELEAKGSNTISVKDILVGDVWVASGQSNMEWQLNKADNASTELAAANHPRIRLFQVNKKVAAYPLDEVDAQSWTVCNSQTAADFSAVAYFFGRHLEEKQNVPIGLISASWGGTPADAWTSLRAISADASLMPVMAEWAKMTDDLAYTKQQREKQISEWKANVEQAKKNNTKEPAFPWRGNDSGEWAPGGLYNAMIAPLVRFPIRGAIWYQGESNASRERAGLYHRLFSAMITDWRRAWGQGDFPFLFVQLANFKTGPDSKWPDLREAQLKTLSLAHTGMAVTTDIGNPTDIHPTNKQDVGLRLARAARAIAYGEKIEYSGPIFRQAVRENNSLRVFFEHAASGLMARGGTLKGFEVAGADRAFVPAEAVIDGQTVVVSQTSVAAPRYVRYSWSDNPEGNLYNKDNLPASPFRSGD